MDKDLQVAIESLAKELSVTVNQINAAIELLDEGNTIPFIARYRKEVTDGLDEMALRAIEDAVEKARELAARKQTVLKTIDGQGLLTDALRKQIEACRDMATLEALYLPYKPKRRTRATVARERGLQPLADVLKAQKSLGKSKADVLKAFVNAGKEVPDAAAALQGALDIIAEEWCDDAPTRLWMTKEVRSRGALSRKSNAVRKKKPPSSKHTWIIAKRPRRFLRIDCWPCSAVKPKGCCGSASNWNRTMPVTR